MGQARNYAKLLCLSALLFALFFVLLDTSHKAEADSYSSTNFQVLDPVIGAGAERGTSNNYVLWESLGELALGTSSITSFELNSGFLTFPTTTPATGVSATAGDTQVALSWTAGTGELGWTVSGYSIGQSTVSGGPYTYSSEGNVTSATVSSLTNDTPYYFVIINEDAFGTHIATSTEVSATPVAAAPTCGDNACNGSENCRTCPADCGNCTGGGGGGGGGGGVSTLLTGSIQVEGLAYPGADIFVLIDNKQVASFKVKDDASFSSRAISANAGNRSIGIFARDKAGRKSLTFTFSVSVSNGRLSKVSDIIIPPTIDLEVEETTPKLLDVMGAAYQKGIVSVVFQSEKIEESVRPTEEGNWEYALDTNILETGDHLVRAKTIIEEEDRESTFSESRVFTVLPDGLLIAQKKVATCGVADFNCDGRVNLIDFSILLYNWGRPSNPKTDLNADGKVDITDFSIMLFYWTG